MIGVTLFVVAVLVIVIWVSVEIKRLKHKLFAVFLIGLILLAYFSITFVFKGEDVNLSTLPGVMHASKIYLSFLGGVVSNLVKVTSHAISMEWFKNSGNLTS